MISFGANKVIYYLSRHHDINRVSHFLLLSPANLAWLMNEVSEHEFTYGNPAGFLSNINSHMPAYKENKLIFIEGTGHTYQRKEQETANKILELLKVWE